VDVLVGRLAELAELRAFLAKAADAPATAVIEGEPGIGKTTLWQVALDQARNDQRTVLACRPVEAETQLAYAGLGDLFADHADLVLSVLPPPQRRALSVALLRTDGTVPTGDPRSVGVAVVTALRALATDRPVLLAVDDLQWLDAPTLRVLAFALRRLRSLPIGLLLARRGHEDTNPPLDLVAGEGPCTRLAVGPLDLRELRRLLAAHLGEAPFRPLLARIAEQSGGNPLYALEIARAVARTGGTLSPSAPLALPRRLGDLVADRVASLAPADRRVLLLVAAAGNPTEAMVWTRPGAAAALDRAESAGLVERASGRVRFTHPLLASALYAGATTSQRRSAHATLAEAVDDPEQRARHLALTTDTADSTIAEALDEAAESAARRGAPDAAVELLELALRRTPDSVAEARARRALNLAGHRFRAGDAPGAATLARTVYALPEPAHLRAEALLLLAQIEHETGSAPEAYRLCEEGLALADGTPVRARLHAVAAHVAVFDIQASARHARHSLDLLSAADVRDPATESLALQAVVGSDLVLGRGFRRKDAERAVELEQPAPPARPSRRGWPGWTSSTPRGMPSTRCGAPPRTKVTRAASLTR
jgi:tetratricopeptide (TPR) repeat protein